MITNDFPFAFKSRATFKNNAILSSIIIMFLESSSSKWLELIFGNSRVSLLKEDFSTLI